MYYTKRERPFNDFQLDQEGKEKVGCRPLNKSCVLCTTRVPMTCLSLSSCMLSWDCGTGKDLYRNSGASC